MPGPILIDARPLQGPSARRGIGSYVRGLLGGFDQTQRARLALLCDEAAPLPQTPGLDDVRTVRRRAHGRWAAYEDAAVLASDLDRIRPALFHATSMSLPNRAPCPVAVTVHDLIPWAWGGPWMAGERLRYWPAKRLLPRAEAAIAVSESTAADAIHLGRVPRERITVVAEGVGPAYRPEPGAAERVAGRWGLRAGYLLFVGALDRRKDPVALVRAWRAVRRAGHDLELVVACPPVADAGALGGARLLQGLPDEDVADLYRAAGCLVFPSRYEGVGLPVLEAMACGCPVVTYSNSSLPEVAGEAGILVRDGDPLALGRAAADLLADPAERERRIRLGLEHARSYTWSKAAAATFAVYRELLREGS